MEPRTRSRNDNRTEVEHIPPELLKIAKGKSIVTLIDGEHYPPVTKATLEFLKNAGCTISALVFLGGAEKVEDPLKSFCEGKDDYKIYKAEGEERPPLDIINAALVENDADIVIDLSDEPIVDYRSRFRIASAVLDRGYVYMGADFVFAPPQEARVLNKPSLGIIGTGKRVGKTGVSVAIARLLDRQGFEPVVVCMGRGGPGEPEVVDPRDMTMGPELLLSVAEKGGHAASDYWEDALLANVPTVGCRRCGGGMGGNPFFSNVIKGAELADALPRKFVIMEGSGATFPPVSTDKKVVVIGAGQPLENIVRFLGEYRTIISDLAIVTMCEEPIAGEEKGRAILDGIIGLKPDMDVALTVFRPEPLGDVRGKKVFVATTAPEGAMEGIARHLEEEYGCSVAGGSNHLSDRTFLRKDLEKGLGDCDVLVTEIKAASIDVAARKAGEKNVDVVFMHNRPVLIGGTVRDLDETVVSLCERAVRGGLG